MWRFHVVHHNDEHVDSTTAFRFHVAEIIGKGVFTLPVIVLGGITIPQVLACETITVVLVVFHHGNLRLPQLGGGRDALGGRHAGDAPGAPLEMAAGDRLQLRRRALDLGSDLFGTFRVRRDPTKIDFGIDGYEGDEVRTFWGIFKTPFGPIKSEFGQTPPEFLDGTEKPRPGDRRHDERLVETKPAGTRDAGLMISWRMIRFGAYLACFVDMVHRHVPARFSWCATTASGHSWCLRCPTSSAPRRSAGCCAGRGPARRWWPGTVGRWRPSAR